MFGQLGAPRGCQSVMKNKSSTSAVALAGEHRERPQSKLQTFIVTVKMTELCAGIKKKTRQKKNHNNNLSKQNLLAVQKPVESRGSLRTTINRTNWRNLELITLPTGETGRCHYSCSSGEEENRQSRKSLGFFKPQRFKQISKDEPVQRITNTKNILLEMWVWEEELKTQLYRNSETIN